MEIDFISSFYNVYTILGESNKDLFNRIDTLEEKISSINIVHTFYTTVQ